MRIAIVTGASSGIGREFVRQLDTCMKTIDEIWVIGRREKRLKELKEKVNNIHLRMLTLDFNKRMDIDILSHLLDSEKPEVRLLVQAAGVGYSGSFKERTRAEAEEMIMVNDLALVSVAHVVIPYMTTPSNMILLASASAFTSQKEFAVYAASKAFVLSFSRALNAELKDDGITVTAVCPGPVETEFLKKCNGDKEEKPLKKKVKVLPAPVVRKALIDAKTGKDISVYGVPMKLVHVASKLVPGRLLLKLM
ncbi:MAG: SDR family NAD(P)-dependent oxidoreductase [Lachnospiraceae bacterium]|nr:SDR family NAD(P)-dependent oxidoreductase [Lachnospiraceae bacterium]